MKLVVVESPYAGDIERNVRYARACMLDCINRGEAPLASHLLYTQPGILDDFDPDERMLGIHAGIAWAVKSDVAYFYLDLGFSKGMSEAYRFYKEIGVPCEPRWFGGWEG